MSAGAEQRKLAAIMFIDMAGFAALAPRNSGKVLARQIPPSVIPGGL